MTLPDLEQSLVDGLSSVLLADEIDGLDEDLIAYMAGMLTSREDDDVDESIEEVLIPFLESVGCPDDLVEKAKQQVRDVLDQQQVPEVPVPTTRKLQQASTKHLKPHPFRSFSHKRSSKGVVHMSSQHAANDADASNLWSIEGDAVVKAMANNIIDAHQEKTSAKDKRRARKVEAEKARKLLSSAADREEDQEDQGVLVRMNVRTLRDGAADKKKDVLVRNVTVALNNGTMLLESGELKMAYQRRYGLIGENGVGKSTLLKAISKGEIEGFPTHLRVLHVRQEVPSNLSDTASVLKAVLNSDVERNALLDREKEILAKMEDLPAESLSFEEKRKKLLERASSSSFESDIKELDDIYSRLQVMSADSAEARAAMILTGLQFSPSMQHGPISALSGGWRMRVALAAALYIEPEILMLDVLWLENYLVSYKHSLLVVSHDRGFLDEVCTDTIEFKRKKLTYYRGNFSTYVKLRDENIRNAMRLRHAYEEKREHMMEFITKFRANAKRSTMVQSRIKAVEKMDAEAPAPVEVDQVWRFSIPNSEPVGPPIIAINDVFFDYKPVNEDGTKKDPDKFLLQSVNFGVDLTSRIAILGANGQGKTTLLNLVMGKLAPIKGTVVVNGNLRIGHFTQHSADNFDLNLSAVENLLTMFDEAEDQAIRSFLGKFQIQGNDALKPMMLLSGGQKSRVAFAALAYKKPHVLVIDEGSNHLSMEAVDALVEAVQDFKGGILVVSHDSYFVSKTCSELWVVHEGVASRFRGDFDEYKKHTTKLTQLRVEESVKKISTMNN